MQANAYLNYDGRCEEAFKFYEKALGGKLQSLATFGETPMKEQVPPEWHGKVIHATLKIGDSLLMGSDSTPEYYKPMQGFSITISTDDPAEAERLFKALSEGGTVRMPIQKTFWARAFGMMVDRFGTPWMVNCE
jgi:PhnB protein